MRDRAAYLQEGERLLTALRGGRLPVPESAASAEQMLRAARSHGVTPALYRAYEDKRAAELAALRADVFSTRAQALVIKAAARDIAAHLTEAQIPYALIKGPVVAEAYANADRSFVDIDVLVAPATMSATIASLAQMGAWVMIEGLGWPRSDGVGELTLGLPSGVSIDLHADLIHHARVRRDFRFPAEPLLDRASTVSLLGAPVRTLTPEDHIIYVALHAMLSGGHRLVWFADLDAMVRNWTPRWDVLVDRAREAKLALVAGVMLARTRDLLGTPVPEDALSALTRRGQAWNRLLRETERRNRIAACHGPYRTGQFSVRATRSSTLTSLAALSGMVRSEVLPPYADRLAAGRLRPLMRGAGA